MYQYRNKNDRRGRPDKEITNKRSRIVLKRPFGKLVRQRPPEIHFDLDDLLAAYQEDLGVAESRAVRAAGLVGNEHAAAGRHHVDEFELRDARAAGPAAFEIGLAIDPVVERAGEAKNTSPAGPS